MDKRKIIQMIDEYLTEPHSISNEWVEALLVCKDTLTYRTHLIDSKLAIESFELAGCKITIDQLKMDVESLTNERDALQEMIIEQKAEMEKKDIEIDILIRKKEALRDEIAEQNAEIERLKTMHSEMCIGMKVLKQKARKEFWERLKKTRQWDVDIPEYVFIVSGDNLLKEMEGEK